MIRIVCEEDRHRSAAYDGETLIGECDYSGDGQLWTVFHTEVNPAYGGQGIAARLVGAVAELARKNHVRIVPVCSYVRRLFETKAEYADVSAENG